MSQEKIFSLKIMQKMRHGSWFQTAFCFLKKLYNRLKQVVCRLISLYFDSTQINIQYNRNKLFKTLHYWSRDMLNFVFLDKSLGIISPAHFVYDFSTKMFIMVYSINWSNFIVCLHLLLEILGNMCIAIVC